MGRGCKSDEPVKPCNCAAFYLCSKPLGNLVGRIWQNIVVEGNHALGLAGLKPLYVCRPSVPTNAVKPIFRSVAQDALHGQFMPSLFERGVGHTIVCRVAASLVPVLAPFLVPVALNLRDVQDLVPARVSALVKTNVREHVRLIPMLGGEHGGIPGYVYRKHQQEFAVVFATGHFEHLELCRVGAAIT